MTDPNGRRYYRCRRKRGEATGTCTMPNLPQELVDETMLRYLSEHVISAGLTASELEAEQRRAVKDAAKAKSDAQRAIRRADDREASAELTGSTPRSKISAGESYRSASMPSANRRARRSRRPRAPWRRWLSPTARR